MKKNEKSNKSPQTDSIRSKQSGTKNSKQSKRKSTRSSTKRTSTAKAKATSKGGEPSWDSIFEFEETGIKAPTINKRRKWRWWR